MVTVTKDDSVSSYKSSAQNFQDVGRAANAAKDDLQNAANQAGRKVRDLYNSASEGISEATDTMTTQIRDNPVKASLVALGVGFIIGALFRR